MGKRWNGCGSHGVCCIPSSLFSPLMSPSKSLFAPESERAGAAALESSWVPTLPQGKSKRHPHLEEGWLKAPGASAFAGILRRLVMAFGQRHLSPRTWAGTTNLSHADHKTTIT